MFAALGLVPILCTPLYMLMMGFRLFPLRVQIFSGFITFAIWTAIFWFGLRFGRIAWAFILAVVFGITLLAWLRSLF